MIYTRYWFWLLILAAVVTILERIFPWRKKQKLFRALLLQDIFWISFNGYLFGRFFGFINGNINQLISAGFMRVSGLSPHMNLIGSYPFLIKVLISLLILDFTEWCVHNLLHRVPWLWKFHRVHHSIQIMDWIGNFRFHWVELIVYNAFKFLPIALFTGGDWRVLIAVGIVSTLIGNLNHANLKITWGPLRYLLNSPAMHIWHHDKNPDNTSGYNFAVVFSLWDWLFRTAYMPLDHTPKELGFSNDEQTSPHLLMRFFLPFITSPSKGTKA